MLSSSCLNNYDLIEKHIKINLDFILYVNFLIYEYTSIYV